MRGQDTAMVRGANTPPFDRSSKQKINKETHNSFIL